MQALAAPLPRLALAFLVLCAGILTAPTADAQGERGFDDAHVLTCPTCEGAAQVSALCWFCRGEKRTCPQSDYHKPSYPKRWQGDWLPDAWWQLIHELASEDVENGTTTRRTMSFHLRAHGNRLDPAPAPSHELPCPAGCEDGKLPLGEQWVDCRLCSRGKHACPTCKKRPARCPPCDGEGSLAAACPDCAGGGTLADPRQTDPALCPWSGTAGERACGSCDAEGRVTLACRSCGGHGSLSCASCQGLGKVPCPGCFGRGRLPSGSCVACDRRGSLPCLVCDGGSRACNECDGTRTISASCPHCGGSKRHACNGCTEGSYAAWEHAASWCLELRRPDRAVLLLEVALARCEARYVATSYPPRLSEGDLHYDAFLSSLLGRGGKLTRLTFEEAREKERQEEVDRLQASLRRARQAAK